MIDATTRLAVGRVSVMWSMSALNRSGAVSRFVVPLHVVGADHQEHVIGVVGVQFGHNAGS